MAWKRPSPSYSPAPPATKTVGGHNVTKFCVTCGRKLLPKHIFCPGCGTKHGHFVLIEDTGRSNCVNCSHKIEDGDQFCHSCGEQIDRPRLMLPTCDCGAMIAEHASYCGKCGKPAVKATPATNLSP